MNIEIEPYAQDRANEIADLYHASVHVIEEDIYTKPEQEAWAPTPPNYEAWVNRLIIKKPFLAVANEKVLGFIELEDDGHIDCAYTHPQYQTDTQPCRFPVRSEKQRLPYHSGSMPRFRPPADRIIYIHLH